MRLMCFVSLMAAIIFGLLSIWFNATKQKLVGSGSAGGENYSQWYDNPGTQAANKP